MPAGSRGFLSNVSRNIEIDEAPKNISFFIQIFTSASSLFWTKMPKLKNPFRSKKSKSQSALPTRFPSTPEPSSSQTTTPQDPHVESSQTITSPAPTAIETPGSLALIRKGQNYGINQLYIGTKASVDIVFVHGLTGNSYNTWLHQGTEVHWPSDLLKQDIPDSRILSFGYDADIVNLWNPTSVSRLSNHAERMVGDLVRIRERTDTQSRKILFVAHSLGGLVTKHALIHSRNNHEQFLRQIEENTAGIVFLGVPHFGSDLASWGSFATQMIHVLKRANKDIVRVLEPESEILRNVGLGFHNILERRKEKGSKISITCFYEELPVIGVGEVL